MTLFATSRSLYAQLNCAPRKTFVYIVLACLTTPLAALDPRTDVNAYSVRGWSTGDGLPSSRVRGAIQTRDGYLWLATAQGIARFDGSHFTVFSPENRADLTASNFYDVVEAPDRTLWFSSNNGLFHWANEHFKRFGTAEGLASDYVRSVTLLRDGSLLASTNEGISTLRNGRIEGPPIWPEVSDKVRSARTFLQTSDGSVYVGSANGLWRAKDSRLEKISGQGTSLPDAAYTALLERPDGRLWIGTTRGLHCLKSDGGVEVFTASAGLTSPSVESLHFDRKGNLWIGTTGGLFRMTDGRIEHAAYPQGFGNSLIGQILEDREGSLWVPSYAGIFQLKDTPIVSIGQPDGLEQTAVNTIIEIRDHTWLIGLWSGGVYRYKNGRAVAMPELAGLESRVVYAFLEDTEGVLWIGAEDGLYRFANGRLDNFYLGAAAKKWREQLASDPNLTLPGLVHGRVSCIVSDGEGGLWVATNGALYHAKDNRFQVVKTGNSQSYRAVFRARNGDIWATTTEGTVRLHDGKWIVYRTADGMSSDLGRMIYEDTLGSIWVTTAGSGLNRFKDGYWHAYTTREGLIENFVSSIVEGDKGVFWIGTSHGVMRLTERAFDDLDAGKIAVMTPQILDHLDGLPSSDCSEPGSPNAWKTTDGHLLFPTSRGVAAIDPSRVTFNDQSPSVHIERLIADGAAVELSRNVVVSPGRRDIEIHYTATSLLSPEKVRFKTKLTPIDTDWNESAERRDIHFARLPPGSYVFHVIAANNDGVWNQKGASIAFTVQPFFYQTYWFRGLLILLLLSAAASAYAWRLRRLRAGAMELQRQNAELERRVAERTAELAKSYETLRASEYFYHSLIESLPQIIVRKDADGRHTYANSAFAELVNRPIDGIIGKTDHEILPPDVAAKIRESDLHTMATRQVMEYENVVEKEGKKKRYLHVKKVPLFDQKNNPMGVQVLFWDMTIFRETEEKLRQAQKELLETSRLAGIAEVATGVLHNIGNVLNSVNISAAMASDRIRNLNTSGAAKVAQLLTEQGARLGEFLAVDPRGKQVPDYLIKLAQHLEGERTGAMRELKSLQGNIEHIKEIVAAQQSHARVSGFTEEIPASELLEIALRMCEASLSRHGIIVTREFMPTPAVNVQKQKALQILVNLLRNAKESIMESNRSDPQLVLALRLSPTGNVQILVTDNGAGIAPENLTRIFGFGFTTKMTGHGFGLHTSALAAKEMGGALSAQSNGLGKGATFTFEMPVSVAAVDAAATLAVTEVARSCG